ncbi:MAG TPA: ferritin family protein [Firmicutes bacterium]|nr:ferritin family protein [Bacillota bacterium]
MDELEAVRLAELLEDSGYRFYQEAAGKAEGTNLKGMLLHLAKMEQEHKATFHGLYQDLLAGKWNYDDSYLYVEEVEKFFRLLADSAVFPEPEAVPEIVAGLHSVRDVLELAIRAEKDSIFFYEKLAQEARLPATREAAQELIREELTHLDDLVKARAALGR